jgi:hypothetical protein
MDRNEAFINFFLPPEPFEPAGPRLLGCVGDGSPRTDQSALDQARGHLEEVWGGGRQS